MNRLPDFQREALKLSFFNGLSHREIAAHTRTPLGTVKTRLELGLRKLSSSVRVGGRWWVGVCGGVWVGWGYCE
jgi:RNA polymerase sigma-70 factor (ECF subfamily)